jgi:hypothetical protein
MLAQTLEFLSVKLREIEAFEAQVSREDFDYEWFVKDDRRECGKNLRLHFGPSLKN